MLTDLFTPKSPKLRERVHETLRLHTDEAHNRLHQHACFVALFDETLSLKDYRQLMRRLHGFYAPLDLAILSALPAATGGQAVFDYAERAPLLARDMAALGFSATDIADNPRCEHVFDIVTPGTVGGVLYVVEGATLGGTLIDRAARKLLSDTAPNGRHYWNWCRSEGKYRWSMTRRHLQELGQHGAPLGDLSAGAQDTFQALADWLASLDHAQARASEGPA